LGPACNLYFTCRKSHKNAEKAECQSWTAHFHAAEKHKQLCLCLAVLMLRVAKLESMLSLFHVVQQDFIVGVNRPYEFNI
jgi:hypothetical protein